jgi:uncharacterized OsmC-like protein
MAEARPLPEPLTVDLVQQDGYRFRVDVHEPGTELFTVDEPPPLGLGAGPSASRLLAAAVVECLGQSLLFCLARARIAVAGIRVHVRARHARTPQGRLRISELEVELSVEAAAPDWERAGRCLAIFQDFCTVTASVRPAIPVSVAVERRDPEAGG